MDGGVCEDSRGKLDVIMGDPLLSTIIFLEPRIFPSGVVVWTFSVRCSFLALDTALRSKSHCERPYLARLARQQEPYLEMMVGSLRFKACRGKEFGVKSVVWKAARHQRSMNCSSGNL